MKISTKTQYGLRAMAYIAQSGKNGRLCSTKEISASESIPFDYLEKIASKLEKAGFLKAKKGSLGGYSLAMPAEMIRIGGIIRALEPSSALVKCANGGAGCPNAGSCSTRNFWRKFQQAIDAALDSLTLKDLLNDDYRLIEQRKFVSNKK